MSTVKITLSTVVIIPHLNITTWTWQYSIYSTKFANKENGTITTKAIL